MKVQSPIPTSNKTENTDRFKSSSSTKKKVSFHLGLLVYNHYVTHDALMTNQLIVMLSYNVIKYSLIGKIT